MGESITTARHGLKTLSTHCSGPSEIKLWDFLYSEWGALNLILAKNSVYGDFSACQVFL